MNNTKKMRTAYDTLLKPGTLAAGMVGSIRHTITAGTQL